ncbi:MAG: pyridoxamine 5'-phosphate oxidase family protein [Tannerella sp.]|jgi:general stress protein 26|nr:pyridoxamine 5'-phosphate oxidase family protein [Tannerella sp.]
MEKKASEIQKERIKDLEQKASLLLEKCTTVTLASVNENGYPRICTITKQKANSFKDIYFITSKRSALNGKATHFENNPKASVCFNIGGDSVTLIGDIEFIEDKELQDMLWNETDRKFFKKGTDDPTFRLLKFKTIEATFWIEGKFRTVKYKKESHK